jgi:hypothetical protein
MDSLIQRVLCRDPFSRVKETERMDYYWVENSEKGINRIQTGFLRMPSLVNLQRALFM